MLCPIPGVITPSRPNFSTMVQACCSIIAINSRASVNIASSLSPYARKLLPLSASQIERSSAKLGVMTCTLSSTPADTTRRALVTDVGSNHTGLEGKAALEKNAANVTQEKSHVATGNREFAACHKPRTELPNQNVPHCRPRTPPQPPRAEACADATALRPGDQKQPYCRKLERGRLHCRKMHCTRQHYILVLCAQ
eukprot:m.220087 g.220087  ORF g.220087 m.220087 type:complete len:196 (+) comp22267_c18_seq2:439-1026(+)